MHLAKPCLDVGLHTNRIDEMRAFYEGRLGLAYEELLRVGGGIHQHRLALHGSVLKINHSRDPLPDAPTCFRGLTVPGSGETITDPDGLAVHRDGADRGIAVAWATRDVGRLHAMLVDGFGAHAESDTSVRLGTTRLDLVDDPDAGPVGHVAARGFRYLTVQVFDVLAAHEHLLASGWQEGIAPRRLGDVAMISFVRDPEGSWIEVSQRASVTGPLPG